MRSILNWVGQRAESHRARCNDLRFICSSSYSPSSSSSSCSSSYYCSLSSSSDVSSFKSVVHFLLPSQASGEEEEAVVGSRQRPADIADPTKSIRRLLLLSDFCPNMYSQRTHPAPAYTIRLYSPNNYCACMWTYSPCNTYSSRLWTHSSTFRKMVCVSHRVG